MSPSGAPRSARLGVERGAVSRGAVVVVLGLAVLAVAAFALLTRGQGRTTPASNPWDEVDVGAPPAHPPAAPQATPSPAPAAPPPAPSAGAPKAGTDGGGAAGPGPAPTKPPPSGEPTRGTAPASGTAPPAAPDAAAAAVSPSVLLVAGPDAAAMVAAAKEIVSADGFAAPGARPIQFRVAGADPAADGDAASVRVERAALLLVRPPKPSLSDDPLGDLVPPAGLLGAALREVSLPVARPARPAALVALAAVLARDGRAAAKALKDVPLDAGTKILNGAASLLSGEYAAVHLAVYGLADDKALGPVARWLTGAALRADRNVREALRDFQAAVAANPDYWPARLLAAEALESADLNLPDQAASAYAAVAKAAPDEPAAALGHAYYLAAADRAAAIALLSRLLDRLPECVAGWRLRSNVRAQAGTSADLRAAAEDLVRVTSLRPDDPRAWGDLGIARWRWADAGGGAEVYSAAADAFARQTDLAPDEGVAWFHRGASIHQFALGTPLRGDPTVFRTRLGEARTCYAKALAVGLKRAEAARAQFNIGRVLDVVPSTPPSPGVAATAADAYQAALDADPTYSVAVYALVAARVGERDAKGAEAALGKAPPDAGKESRDDRLARAALEAATALLRGDTARARSLIAGPGEMPVAGADPLTPIAKALLVAEYRRAVVGLLAAETRDAARLTLRARARAGLRDVEGLGADLDRLQRLDPAAAKDLRQNDPDVIAALGAP